MSLKLDEVAGSERRIAALLRRRELAEQLGISQRTLAVWMAQGRIPYLKIGYAVRFFFPDVMAKLQSYRVN